MMQCIRIFAPLLALFLGTGWCAGEARLWLQARINDQPVHLVFDTASESPFLFRSAAARLSLKVRDWPAGQAPEAGKSSYGLTERCELTVAGSTVPARFAVVDLPGLAQPEMDGGLSWSALRQNVLELDCLKQVMTIADKAPSGPAWLKFRLSQPADVLAFNEQSGQGMIVVDTGNPEGVSLNHEDWQKWLAAHPERRRTLREYVMPGAGVEVKEEAWAPELRLGGLVLTDVPVREANQAEALLGGPNFIAALGIAALRRFAVIADGRRGDIYFKANTGSAPPFNHNRLGAVFVPAAGTRGERVAQVVEGGPAFQAGIRDGDVLLEANEIDAAKLAKGARQSGSSWYAPAGTRLRLKLRREHTDHETTVVLRDLIGPK